MSSINSIYLGPYLKVKIQRATRDRTITACTNDRCFNHVKSCNNRKFCSECGSPIGKVTVTYEAANVAPGDLEDVTDSRLTHGLVTGEFICMIAHGYKDPPRRFDMDNEKEFTNIHVEQETNWFNTSFENEIKAIADLAGSKNVEVLWGFLQYW